MFSLFRTGKKSSLPTAAEALPGRPERTFEVGDTHAVLGTPLQGPWPDGSEFAMIGMGCFWGVERFFWKLDGVYSTQVGYAGGHTPNPTYKEVCSGQTGHNEVVRVVFDPAKVSYAQILKVFFENHDPTQVMRQGNDVGTQYRSGIYTYSEEQARIARAVMAAVQPKFAEKGFGAIATEVIEAPEFWFAEDYHQQYLEKNPGGYCNHGPNGVSCPIGVLDNG
ncbi:MAG: peptide-methionine (S)-S-oxide reductase MsrA [Myxococcota bacterium]